MFSLIERAKDLASFFDMPVADAEQKLSLGFGVLHEQVAASWKAAHPVTHAEMLDWYRTTQTYIWELSSYHLAPGFNYLGQIGAISDTLFAHGCEKVLVLADGIGDLSIVCIQRGGMAVTYNELAGSRTAQFAAHRARRRDIEWTELLTVDFAPAIGSGWDAVVALDFMEHVPNVPEWVEAIHAGLNRNGFLVAQNAFGIGSGEHGSIPCHLAVNDRFEKDWDPLLSLVGFSQITSNWYRKLQ